MARVFLTTNAGNLAVRYRRRYEAYSKEMELAERQAAGEAKRIAIEFSSATAYVIKRKPPYPYAHGGSPPLPPQYINMQSGDFVEAWQTQVVARTTDIVWTLWNGMWYSKYMLGTRRMIVRPIMSEVMKRVRPIRLRLCREAQERALRAGGKG